MGVNLANPKTVLSWRTINECSRCLEDGMAKQIQNDGSFGKARTAADVAIGSGNGLRALKRYSLSLNHSVLSRLGVASQVPHTDVTQYAGLLLNEDSEQIAAARPASAPQTRTNSVPIRAGGWARR